MAHQHLRAALLTLLAMALAACAAPQAAAPPPSPSPEQVAAAPGFRPDPPAPAIMAAPQASARPTTTPMRGVAAPTATAEPPSPTPAGPTAIPSPTIIPTPTARPAGTPPRVGLQVGHLNSQDLPDELARLRSSTGARWGGVTEAELNYDIAMRVKALLEAEGVIVDIIPATVPPGYDADAFLAIHADGSQGSGPRGWKLATPWRASRASQLLLAAVSASYGPATGLPQDVGGVTVNMRGYYAFNYRRHVHAIARTTPAIIVEMGFMTNAADREVLFNQPDRVARGIAEGTLAYLRQRDPSDGAALLPPEFPGMRARAEGTAVRSGPSESARILGRFDPENRVTVFSERDGWYEGFVRVGEERIIGWIRVDQLEVTNEPPVFPTATNP